MSVERHRQRHVPFQGTEREQQAALEDALSRGARVHFYDDGGAWVRLPGSGLTVWTDGAEVASCYRRLLLQAREGVRVS